MTIKPEFLWYTQCPAPTPLSLAAQKGWLAESFAAHDLAVKSIRQSPDPEVRASHFTHSLDWSFRQGGNIPPLWTRANGRETRVLGITTTDEFQAVITLPGRGITDASDLKGRRIGIPRNDRALIDFQRATALKGVVSALTLAGLTAADVELVWLQDEAFGGDIGQGGYGGLRRSYPYGAEFLALARGEIDAFFVKGAEGLLLAAQFRAVLVADFGFHPDARIRINNGTPRPLTIDAATIARRPDLAEALVASVLRVPVWAKEHPEDAVRLIAREIGVGEDAIWAANGPEVHRHLELTIEEDQIDALQHFVGFLREWDFIPAEFDVRDWVDPAPLAAARAKLAVPA
ncbi:ABC transporter substrate-binding protein [Paracoccus aminophilus]|uniref:ABC-type nitrate/sulfonate/bicarbonate transport systems n=1 Tax=Paracoccus aminophilus JCM 7686 TaxID=1367847 RepID=S5Y4P0_PARAH|nr:ABC transporter substrate-binding protein [Paracoccus aminophilus]AGT10710.1 ABC-type nitrate/sulfonate/bicarbonate transport systems [Paracoccus aminophilus JCM 7686]